MFMLNEILVFSLGRRREALERLEWIHQLMAKQPGFRRAYVGKYLGDGVTYTILRIWDDERSFRTFRESPDGDYGRSRPEGLYTNQQVVPRWLSTKEAAGVEEGPFLVKTQWEVPETVWVVFNEGEHRMEDIEFAFGLKGVKQFRATDRNEAMTVARFPSRKEFEDLIESTEFNEERKLLPEGVRRISSQCFEIVAEVGPA